jgi:hypothetical protein
MEVGSKPPGAEETPEQPPEAERLYAAFYGNEPNKIITYDAMDLVLGRDTRFNRAPVYRFKRLFQKRMKRTIKCVPGIGYRVLEAREHADVADARRGRARRQAMSGIDEAKNVRWDELTKTEKIEVSDCLTRLGSIYQSTIERRRRRQEPDNDSAEKADEAVREGRKEETTASS